MFMWYCRCGIGHMVTQHWDDFLQLDSGFIQKGRKERAVNEEEDEELDIMRKMVRTMVRTRTMRKVARTRTMGRMARKVVRARTMVRERARVMTMTTMTTMSYMSMRGMVLCNVLVARGHDEELLCGRLIY